MEPPELADLEAWRTSSGWWRGDLQLPHRQGWGTLIRSAAAAASAPALLRASTTLQAIQPIELLNEGKAGGIQPQHAFFFFFAKGKMVRSVFCEAERVHTGFGHVWSRIN